MTLHFRFSHSGNQRPKTFRPRLQPQTTICGLFRCLQFNDPCLDVFSLRIHVLGVYTVYMTGSLICNSFMYPETDNLRNDGQISRQPAAKKANNPQNSERNNLYCNYPSILGSPVALNNKGSLFPTIRFLIREPKKKKGKRVLLENLQSQDGPPGGLPKGQRFGSANDAGDPRAPDFEGF